MSEATNGTAHLDKYEFNGFINIRFINSGGEGLVYSAEHTILGEVAVKQMKNNKNYDPMREIKMLAPSQHQNIIQIYGLLVDSQDKCIGYIMEIMEDGSLHDVIHSQQPYSHSLIYSWIYQASLGLSFLHSRGCLHRDVKPSNMLLTNSWKRLKLSDFGTVRHANVTNLTPGVGTHVYTAPEVHDKQGVNYSEPADIYSLTISVYEMFHRKNPYDTSDSYHLIKSIIEENKRPELRTDLPAGISELLERGWKHDINERAKLDDFIDLMKTLQESNDETICHPSREDTGNNYSDLTIVNAAQNMTINSSSIFRNFGRYELNEKGICRLLSYVPETTRQQVIESMQSYIKNSLKSTNGSTSYLISGNLSEKNRQNLQKILDEQDKTEGTAVYEIPLAREDVFYISFKPRRDKLDLFNDDKEKLNNIPEAIFYPGINYPIQVDERHQLDAGKKITIALTGFQESNEALWAFLTTAISLYKQKVLGRIFQGVPDFTICAKGIEAHFTVQSLPLSKPNDDWTIHCLFICHCLQAEKPDQFTGYRPNDPRRILLIEYTDRQARIKSTNLLKKLKLDNYGQPNRSWLSQAHLFDQHKDKSEVENDKTSIIEDCMNAAIQLAYS